MKEEDKKYIESVIKNAGIGYFLTTNLEGMPEARALCNAGNYNNNNLSSDFTLYFATNNNFPKVEQISKNKKTSVYYCLENLNNLMLFGESEIVLDKDLKNNVWQESWEKYYKNGGKDDPEYCIIKFTPKSFKYYNIENGEYKKIEGKI